MILATYNSTIVKRDVWRAINGKSIMLKQKLLIIYCITYDKQVSDITEWPEEPEILETENSELRIRSYLASTDIQALPFSFLCTTNRHFPSWQLFSVQVEPSSGRLSNCIAHQDQCSSCAQGRKHEAFECRQVPDNTHSD